MLYKSMGRIMIFKESASFVHHPLSWKHPKIDDFPNELNLYEVRGFPSNCHGHDGHDYQKAIC